MEAGAVQIVISLARVAATTGLSFLAMPGGSKPIAGQPKRKASQDQGYPCPRNRDKRQPSRMAVA